MNFPITALVGFALLLGQTPQMPPRVFLNFSYSDSANYGITVRDGHIVSERIATKRMRGSDKVSRAEVSWDGWVSVITTADWEASDEWIRTHSLVRRLSIKRDVLYWDGKKVDVGKVKVWAVYEAFPWQNGVMIYGSTTPRRGFFQSWPFKGDFIEVRDLEPYCMIYFDLDSLKGEDRWTNGKMKLSLFVYPLPR